MCLGVLWVLDRFVGWLVWDAGRVCCVLMQFALFDIIWVRDALFGVYVCGLLVGLGFGGFTAGWVD